MPWKSVSNGTLTSDLFHSVQRGRASVVLVSRERTLDRQCEILSNFMKTMKPYKMINLTYVECFTRFAIVSAGAFLFAMKSNRNRGLNKPYDPDIKAFIFYPIR